MEKLELYDSTTFDKGAEVWKCLKQDQLLTFTQPKLNKMHQPHKGNVEDLHKQYNQERSITRSKFAGHVCSNTFNLQFHNLKTRRATVSSMKKLTISRAH